MRLLSAHARDFKCILDSGDFKIDPQITCLVGKNESGKTALLQVLYKLNPVVANQGAFLDTEYPRTRWNEYQERKDDEPATPISTVWELSPQDKAELVEVLGPSVASLNKITISRRYGEGKTFGVRVDEAKVIKHLLDNADLPADQLATLSAVKSIKELKANIVQLHAQSPQLGALHSTLQKYFARDSAALAAIDILARRMPKFVYFSEYMRLPGQMAIDDFKKHGSDTSHPNASAYRMFGALLGLVKRTAEDIEKIDQFEMLQAELEAVSAGLSKTIFKYWSQNKHLLVRFRFDAARQADPAPFNTGWIMRTRIENTRHASTTSFDERSSGFVWFFSFLVWFSQMRRNFGDNLVILLDEPGNSLHAKAQADLLRYMEAELAPQFQVIYTTHSPFMIDPSNLHRARTVEDVSVKGADGEDELLGTRVSGDVLSTDRDTVFPLQAALGYEITQTLFVGKHNLLVEGPSDLLYIQWFQRKLASLGRTTLDRRWTIVPCGGIDKVAAFMSLFGGNGLDVAVFTDFKSGDKRKVRGLIESNLLVEANVLTADVFAGKPEADIEDLLGSAVYERIVNEAFELPSAHQVHLPSEGEVAKQRIVPQVEGAFREMPAGVPEFSHYTPAEYLIARSVAESIPGIEQACDRFEQLFKVLNDLLEPDRAGGSVPDIQTRPIRAGARA